MNNTYAKGFSSCVGLDMALSTFSEYMIKTLNSEELLTKYDQNTRVISGHIMKI